MRILLLGAGGFIGRHILSDLLAVGHEVVGVARSTASLAHTFPDARFVQLNLAQAIHVDDWAPHVLDVDVIVNAAGLLRGRDLEAVHVTMPRALYEASTDAGVRRAVLISAISARVDIATDYSQTKLAGEAALSSSTLDWTILRPSLVYGDGSYGGTSLMVVTADWIFTGTSGVVQPISGLALIRLAGYSWTEPWLLVSYALYLLAFVCWIPVVWLQIKAQRLAQRAVDRGEPLGAAYYRSMSLWFALGWPAFIGLLVAFWLMVAKPILW